MNRQLTIFFTFIILLLVYTSIVSATMTVTNDSEFEWKVEVGDIKKMTYTKVFNVYDPDEDGSAHTITGMHTAENGSKVELTVKKGSTVEYEIIALDDNALIQISLNGVKFPTKEASVVTKTTDNKSYWEEYAKLNSGKFNNYSLNGDLLVISHELYTESGDYISIDEKNWKTGWHVYSYSKQTNATHTLTEMELTAGSPGLISGFEFFPLQVFLVMLSTYILRKRKKGFPFSTRK